MEQPKLSSEFTNVPSVHDLAVGLAERKPPPMLRRSSISEPHLEQRLSALQAVLHGITEANAGYHFVNEHDHHLHYPVTMESSTPTVPAGNANEPLKPSQALERNLSAINLGLLHSSATDSNLGSIRRAASFIHGANLGIPNRPSSSSLYAPRFHPGGNLGSSVIPATTVEESNAPLTGGLTMSVRSSAPLTTSATEPAMNINGGLFANVNTDASSSSRAGGLVSNPSTDSLTSAPQPPHKTGVMGVFGRGFFAKPVYRSDEENYRYIMALDR
uniref:Protein kinase domain-containing protein n=2 Tax=Panagrellus redivivus TaxID=6233 RepID=A0A7E4VXH5_PANRE